MESTSFCAYQDMTNNGLNHCSCESTERPLMVNCAGCFVTRTPFTTYNKEGRLDYYMMHVLSGRLLVPMGDGEVEATSGSVIVFPPRDAYTYTYTGGEELSYEWVHFTGSEAKSALSACGFEKLPMVERIPAPNALNRYFMLLFDAFSKRDSFRDRELSSILDMLLISLGRAGVESGDGGKDLSVSVRYIMTSYAKDLRIPQLAAMEHMSVPRYNARFKALMGISPTKYILGLRITAACDLLLHTDMSVKEIAVLCGYKDPYFFSRAFKEYVGCSPRAYRSGEAADASN